MDSDGSNQSEINSPPCGFGQFSLSPDGSKIADVHDYNIYVMDHDGSNIQELAPYESYGLDEHPTWSLDGSKIAFASDRWGRHSIFARDPEVLQGMATEYSIATEDGCWQLPFVGAGVYQY